MILLGIRHRCIIASPGLGSNAISQKRFRDESNLPGFLPGLVPSTNGFFSWDHENIMGRSW